MYLDDESVEVEHLCYPAHARNKFKDAYNQGCEKARFFLEQIAKLYKREEDYRRTASERRNATMLIRMELWSVYGVSFMICLHNPKRG